MDGPLLTIGYSTLADRATDIVLPPSRDDTEILIVIQGGTGSPPERDDVRVIHLDSIGVARSRNAVLDEAAGQLVLFGDDDITWDETGVRRAVEHLEKRPDTAVLMGRAVHPDGTPRKRYPSRRCRLHRFNAAKAGTVELVVRRAAIDGAGIRFNESFGAGATNYLGDEYLFIVDALRAGLRGEFVPITLAVHPPVSSGLGFGTPRDARARAAVFDQAFGRAAPLPRLLFAGRHFRRFANPVLALRFVVGRFANDAS